MGQKSSISRLEPDVKKYLEKQLRADQLTLDELLEDLRQKFPSAKTPSRSSLGRYKANFEELAGRMREIEAGAAALVDELGEGVGDKAGALLTQAVTTLAASTALRAHETDGISIKEVGELARAARAAMQARTMSLKERQEIEAYARQKLLEEQAQKLDSLEKKGGVTDETKAAIREALGIV